MTAEELDVIYQIRKALDVGHEVMLYDLPDICRKLREENEERHHRVLSLILERDRYRMEAEEKWRCRKEIDDALGVDEGMGYDEALRVALETIRKLKSPDLRTVLGYEAGMRHAAYIAQRVKSPKAIGKDKGRHHEAGAQAAAKAILEALGE